MDVFYLNIDKEKLNNDKAQELTFEKKFSYNEVLICGDVDDHIYDVLITYAICSLHMPTLITGKSNNSINLLTSTQLLFIDNSEDAIEKFLTLGKKRGKLIVIEGMDGCGKTTQTKLLKERMNVKTLRFPDRKGLFGNLINDLLMQKDQKYSLNSFTFITLCAANRYDKLSLLNWWLWKGETVVLDRYSTSNFAYQIALSFLAGKFTPFDLMDTLEKIEYGLFKLPIPDRIFLLSNEVDTTLRNVAKRGDNLDIFEQKGQRFYSWLNAAYIFCAENQKNWKIVGCEKRSIEQIHEELKSEIEKLTCLE